MEIVKCLNFLYSYVFSVALHASGMISSIITIYRVKVDKLTTNTFNGIYNYNNIIYLCRNQHAIRMAQSTAVMIVVAMTMAVIIRGSMYMCPSDCGGLVG